MIVIPDESHSPKLLAETENDKVAEEELPPPPPPPPPTAAIPPTTAKTPNWDPPAVPVKILVFAKLLNKSGSKEL